MKGLEFIARYKKLLNGGFVLVALLLYIIAAGSPSGVTKDILGGLASAFLGAGVIGMILGYVGEADKSSKSDLAAVVATLKVEPIREVARWVLALSQRTAHQLQHPSSEYPTQEEYLRRLLPYVNKTTKGEVIKAVCGKKNWRDQNLMRYLKSNFDACQRGVSITRIFVQDRSFDKNALLPTMRDQHKNGIKVLFVSAQDLQKEMSMGRISFQDGFGFVLIDYQRAVIHNAFNNSDEKAYAFEDPIIIDVLDELFEQLKNIAKEYNPAKEYELFQ